MTEGDEQLPFAAFSRASEFIQDARQLTNVDFDALPTAQEEQEEIKLLSGLCAMLDEYQEQSYLLDPSLEALVSPLLDTLRQNVRRPNPRLATARMQRLARLIYFLTKVRGAKTIVRFFPHEVTDLVLLVRLLSPSSSSPSSSTAPSATAEIASSSWELRYVLLLWLSVAVRLPFDLARLDPGTGEAIEEVGMRYLGTASKERDGATEVLARFYARRVPFAGSRPGWQDAPLGSLLKACEENLAKLETVSIASGLIQTLCEVVKTASPATLNTYWPQLYQLLAFLPAGAGGPLLAKYRVKLAGRLALMRLTTTDGDVPEEVEVVLGELLEGLSHTDTIVRWSAAKYIARITSLLPVSFASEIVDAVLGIFEDGLEDSDRAEHGLQGACFAFGELGRRGKIREREQVDRLLKGVMQRESDDGHEQALLLDHRRNMQTIGSSVRDSAAYVLWSLARTLSPSQAQLYAQKLAERLVCVALFDREVAIRRAASAAFQEGVGRWGVFPHGIDVLRKIDFFTVSIRHRAFLEAAPSVARYIPSEPSLSFATPDGLAHLAHLRRHPEYRLPVLNHLISTGITHYDPDIRVLSAKALGKIVSLDAEEHASGLVGEQIGKLATNDPAKLHGVLLSLAALADSTANVPAEPREELRAKIFSATCSLLASPSSRQLRTSHAVLFAALSSVASSAPVSCPPGSSVAQLSSNWFELVHLACEHQEESVHEQAGAAMRRMSETQCAALLLGEVDYAGPNRGKLVKVVERLTVFIQREVSCSPSFTWVDWG
ncbi:SPOSA6832_04967 [Sporobolomyces salmonicolor]|uniref:SPOSA6832_04967-mRNA-1:cds n=1 Tax=Sporidiobolus salmonicolor TaxID=5005 RepID=A0A0D6ESG9_SPOSA|nr:SPOSA6832_04967 [Sporobolomyces salmonicolor]